MSQIARTVLFGKTATESADRAVSRSISQYLRTDIAAETTFGLIAWICMMVCVLFLKQTIRFKFDISLERQACYLLSKDVRFENTGIGSQTKINYAADFAYYKRRLTEFYHSADTHKLILTLLEAWDREVFSNHNKRKGHIGDDEDAEVIDIPDFDADALEIAEDLAKVQLQMATRSNTPIVIDAPAVPQPIPQPIALDDIDLDDLDDIYGDEAPPSPPRPGTVNPPAAALPPNVAVFIPPTPSSPSESQSGATDLFFHQNFRDRLTITPSFCPTAIDGGINAGRIYP